MTENTTGRVVRVWAHVAGDFEEFPEAVAQIHANGALIIMQWGPGASPIPLKGYATGMWYTFEHRGDYTIPVLAPPAPAADQATKDYVDEVLALPTELAPDPSMRRRSLPADRTYDRPKATDDGWGDQTVVEPEPAPRSWGRRRKSHAH